MTFFARSLTALALKGRARAGLALAGLAILLSVPAALAQSPGPSLVIDASTGAVLHEEQASLAWHPASTTKMMTAYVALRMVRARRIGLETPIPASKLAASQPRVKVYIKAGQEITLDNALKVMMVKSANDIAYVIAEGVGGSVPEFVSMMNAEARRLGMSDTVFRNPNGWHHPEQQTSARDLGILAMTMLREFPEYSDYWGIGAVQLGKVTLTNTNGLIGRYAGANGFKTGFVCASGFNVVATATRGGRTLIAIVLGAYSGAERTVKGAQILDAAFASWGGGRSVASIPPSGATARNICAEVRAFGRGAPLSDDADATGPISFTPAVLSDGDVMRAGLMPAAPSASMRASGGRITLGPRTQFVPLQIAYGRTSGSASAPLAANVTPRPTSAVAAAPARGAAEALAAAPAGEPAAPPRVMPGAAPIRAGAISGGTVAGGGIAGGSLGGGAVAASASAYAASRSAAQSSEGPIKLHGAIGQGAAAPLRPSAAAGIRTPARPASSAPQTAAAPAAAPSASAKPALARPAVAKPAAATLSKPAVQRAAAASPKPPAASAATGQRPVATPPRRPAASPAAAD